MRPFRTSGKIGPYWLAILSVLLGLLLRFLVDPWLGDQMPYITFLVSVAITGLYAGVRPALVSTGLGAALAYWCFVPPRYQWGFAGMSDAVGFLSYLAAALAMVVLTHARTSAYEEAARALQERVRAERKLHDAQRLLQLFMDNRPGCAYLRNAVGEFVYANREARILLGIVDGNADRSCEAFVKLDKQDRQVTGSPTSPRQFVDKMRFRDQERYWLTTKFIFIDEEQRRFIGSLSIDITDQTRAEQITLEAERLAAATEMVSMVAHEINNPLAAVTNSLYLLGREMLPARADELVTMAQDELSRLVRISRLALGFYQESEEPVAIDACELVNSVVNEMAAHFPERYVHIQRDFKCKDDFCACTGQVRQALQAIVANSFESGASRIRVRVARSRDWVLPSRSGLRISILDDGAGMGPQQRKQAFQPFFSTRSEKGRGLGLWMSKAIALRHGGRVAIHSTDRPGRHGTCLSIFLPDHTMNRDRVLLSSSAGQRCA
jgi:signal transduction histidine kinase